MSSENKTTYKLNFINQSEFEIICEDKAQTLVIQNLLRGASFIENIIPTFDLDQEFPDKINGETTSQDGLIALLKGWDEIMNNMEVSKYTDF